MTEISDWSRRRWLATMAAAAAAASTAGAALAATAAAPQATDPAVTLRALVRAMLAFDDPRFPALSPADIEARMAGVANLLTDAGYRAGLAAFEARSIAAPGPAAPFSALSLTDARRVVAAWFASPDARQRAFVASTKTVAMIALYSSEKAWQAIGYDGPFRSQAPG